MIEWKFFNVGILTLVLYAVHNLVSFQGQLFHLWDYGSCILFENSPSIEVYDFIVGSAGAVVANRLSKNSKVLLLEAGGYPPWLTYVPVLSSELQHHPEVNWGYTTVPQKYSQFSMPNRQSQWPRGKVLGGSSILNYMLYVTANPLDYDNWSNITGDKSWKYDALLPFFKRSVVSDESSVHGGLHVESRLHPGPLYDTVLKASSEMGLPEVDLNRPQRKGVGLLEFTSRQGRRYSTYSAFIESISDRENLRILKYSQVTKIKLDHHGKAVGVWFVRHGRRYFVRASKEIIISCGAVDSPKLLMLSGIGPKDDLENIGIKSKVDLPVGKFLKDHLMVLLTPFLFNKTISILPELDFGLSTIYDYFMRGTGHMTYPGLVYAHGFINSTIAPTQWPDIQLYFGNVGIYENFGKDLSRVTGIRTEDLQKYLKPYLGSQGMSLGVCIVRPKSFGSLKLRSKDPWDAPLIDPRYLEHQDDIKALLDGIKFAVELAENTEAFKKVNSSMPSEMRWPGCERVKDQRSDEYWECFARHVGFTLYHPIGTCRMGKGVEDKWAVVDSQLRVLETRGLRVADASVMPEIVNGNTNAPTIMIGEKAADMIREYWSEQYLVCDKMEPIFRKSQLLATSACHRQCFYSQLV